MTESVKICSFISLLKYILDQLPYRAIEISKTVIALKEFITCCAWCTHTCTHKSHIK